MHIDRVIELDMDTQRDPSLRVRIVTSTPYRQGIIPHEASSKLDIIVLTNGLLAAILKAEKDGTYTSGEAMKKVMDNLEQGYVDTDIEVVDNRVNTNGTISNN